MKDKNIFLLSETFLFSFLDKNTFLFLETHFFVKIPKNLIASTIKLISLPRQILKNIDIHWQKPRQMPRRISYTEFRIPVSRTFQINMLAEIIRLCSLNMIKFY